jgi:phosphoadenosine phosphosulfate reductase
VSTVTHEELKVLAEAHEGAAPEVILAAAAARLPGRIALACSFGEEDCLLVDVVARASLPVEIFTLDTGYLFPETLELWRRLEERYRLVIRAVRGEAPARAAGAPEPWESDPDACCDARKVRPLRAALASLGAWVTGIRRDQTPDRAGARTFEWDARFGLAKVSPLVRWTRADVARYLELHAVPVNPLHARGYASIGCAPCTTPVKPGEDPRAGRWRGREKTECGLHLRPAGEVVPVPSLRGDDPGPARP